MAAQKQETAEQKLLKMIEASQAAAKASSVGATAGAAGTKAAAGGPTKVVKKHTFLSSLKIFNKFFILGVVLSVLFFAYEIKAGMDFAGREINISLDDENTRNSNLSNVHMPLVQKLSYYTSAIKKRDIFQPYEAAVGKSEIANNNRRVADQAKNLRLVGIAWLDTVDSASAMIEDKDKKVTYFLQTGGKIGNINVKTIYADSVVLGYDNEEITIQYDKPKL